MNLKTTPPPPLRQATLGWDIGGVNTKVARVDPSDGNILTRSRPFEVQRAPDRLVEVLRSLADEVGAKPGDRHGVTMTAELSQMFRTKREGVGTVLDAVVAAFPEAEISVYTIDGCFLAPAAARAEPTAVAASNWAATAALVSESHPDCILLDIGTTTTDVIPIVGGRVAARGRTDLERLRESELVYTGALRTPVEAVASEVPLGDDAHAGLAAEGFALMGDVHLWLGALPPADYSVVAPDGRPATREFAGERLRRAVCADREMLSPAAVDRIARFLADAQVERIATALRRISGRESLREAVVTGVGEFIAVEAALRAGLTVAHLADRLGRDASRTAPAAAVAILLSRRSGDDSGTTKRPATPATATSPTTSTGTRGLSVIKIGGGISATAGGLGRIGDALARARRSARFVVIPGGGPFADTVRAFDAHAGLTAEAAHWMAILGMDQYAYALVAHIPGAVLVEEAAQVGEALTSGMIPVLAPSRWLRAADELPHRWEVTSDSLAAYLAGLLGAMQLVLVKPVAGAVDDLVDPWFRLTAPDGIRVDVLGYREIDQLEGLLRG